MTQLHSTRMNAQIQVQVSYGIKILDANAITRLIASLTDDPHAIMRATDLIIRQLVLYPTIKEFDVKRIIFKTLKQLNYTQMAAQYYRQFLANEF